MKMFTKLALISSMAISANAMAMQSMDDAALGATTGQDGINIGLGISRLTIDKVLIHDNDGLAGTAADAGAIVIKSNATQTTGISITANAAALLPSHNLADIVIDTDAGIGNVSTGTGTAYLNIAANVSGLNIGIGEVGVSGSNAVGTTVRRGNDAANYNKILSGLTLTTGTMTANVQLGAAPQGAMVKLNSTMTGGLSISNLGIYDASSIGTVHYNAAGTVVTSTLAGEIRIDSIKLADASGTNLTVQADISVVGEAVAGDNTGYLQINTMKTASDAYIKGVHLGSATAGSIGDIEVQGLNVYNGPTGTTAGALIKISGH
jgi:hypothetical protein